MNTRIGYRVLLISNSWPGRRFLLLYNHVDKSGSTGLGVPVFGAIGSVRGLLWRVVSVDLSFLVIDFFSMM